MYLLCPKISNLNAFQVSCTTVCKFDVNVSPEILTFEAFFIAWMLNSY